MLPDSFQDIDSDPGVECLVGTLEDIERIHTSDTLFLLVARLAVSRGSLVSFLRPKPKTGASD